MILLNEAFILKNVSDIERQLLATGSDSEKITTATNIIDNNQSGNLDVSNFKEVVVQSIIQHGTDKNNPFLQFLNSAGAPSFVSQITPDFAWSILDIVSTGNQYLKELFYSKDIGIFTGSKSDIEYKLKIFKVFTDKNELNNYKNDKDKVLTLADIMHKGVLRDTSEIRSILDKYFTNNDKDEEKDKIPLTTILKKKGKDYKKAPNEVLTFLQSYFSGKYNKAIAEVERTEKIKITPATIINKLSSIFNDDTTGAKVEKFVTSVQVDDPAGVNDIIKALVFELDDTKGGTLISGAQLVANHLGKSLKDTSFKELIAYVIELAKASTVPYIKSNLKHIQYNFPRGKYDKEFREVFNARYKIDTKNPANTIKFLNERIARLLQDIYAADTDTPVVKEN